MVRSMIAAAMMLAACDLEPPSRASFACNSGGPCDFDASVYDGGQHDAGAPPGCGPSSSPARAQLALIIDSTAVMTGDVREELTCPFFITNFKSGDFRLNRLERVVAALIGCENSADGLLDEWFDAGVAVSVLSFGTAENRGRLLTGFGNDLSLTEVSVAGYLQPIGNQGAAEAFRLAAEQFNSCFNNSNSRSTVPNGIIFISAGVFTVASSRFDFACNSTSIGEVMDVELPRAADYLANHDLICALDGSQFVRTEVIGVAPATQMIELANAGNGKLFDATDVASIRRALESAFSDLVP